MGYQSPRTPQGTNTEYIQEWMSPDVSICVGNSDVLSTCCGLNTWVDIGAVVSMTLGV